MRQETHGCAGTRAKSSRKAGRSSRNDWLLCAVFLQAAAGDPDPPMPTPKYACSASSSYPLYPQTPIIIFGGQSIHAKGCSPMPIDGPIVHEKPIHRSGARRQSAMSLLDAGRMIRKPAQHLCPGGRSRGCPDRGRGQSGKNISLNPADQPAFRPASSGKSAAFCAAWPGSPSIGPGPGCWFPILDWSRPWSSRPPAPPG